MIKFVDFNNQYINGELYNFSSNLNNYVNCIYTLNSNQNLPLFKNPSKNQFNLLQGSAAIGLGIFDPLVQKDILNIDRPINPDLGAYQTQ